MELEAACDPSERGAYPFDVVAGVLDARETILAARRDVTRGVDVGRSSRRASTTRSPTRPPTSARAWPATAGSTRVVLAGGAFQNRRLLERTAAAARAAAGLRVLVPERLPPNDGGVAFGQAAVAAARIVAG